MILTALGCTMVASTYSQVLDVSLQQIRNPQPEMLYVWQDSGMRMGIATPHFNVVHRGRKIAEIGSWLISDSRDLGDNLYVGVGLSVPLFENDRAKLSLAAGWNSAFSRSTLGEPFGVRRGDGYALGIQWLYRW